MSFNVCGHLERSGRCGCWVVVRETTPYLSGITYSRGSGCNNLNIASLIQDAGCGGSQALKIAAGSVNGLVSCLHKHSLRRQNEGATS